MQRARSPRAPIALAVALLGVLLSLLSAPSASAMQPDPKNDWYRIPQGCAGPARPDAQVPSGCRLTPWVRNRPTVVLWGDSHAWQNIPALIRAAKAEDVNLTAFVMGKCPPSKIRIQKKYPGKCEASNALALRYVRAAARRHPVQVILGSHWAGFGAAAHYLAQHGEPPAGYSEFDVRMLKLFRDHTAKLFPALLRTRAELAMVGQTATCEKRPNTAPFKCSMPRRDAILHEAKTRRWLAGLSRNAPQINVNRAFCGPERCRGKDDGDFVFWDWGHLSKTVNYRMASYFRPLLRDFRN
jgi:hypothetical protein